MRLFISRLPANIPSSRKARGCTSAGVFLLLILLLAPATLAVKIADITRIGGQRTNLLTGLGLVYGLDGTGDGGGFSAAVNPLREMLAKFNDDVPVKDLASAQNVAVVAITATIPAIGVRNGDHIDVHVTSIGAASSLKGGRLFVTPLQGPDPNDHTVLALAEGPVDIEDPSSPTVGVIRASSGGAVMEKDLPARSIDDNGRFTLIIDDPSASWTMASTIADIINDEEGDGQTLATAFDQKNVIVTIPPDEREHPDAFISRVQLLPVKIVPTEARVEINTHTGTIIMTGDVEISPVVISHKGLSISTINPSPQPSFAHPQVNTQDVVTVGTDDSSGGNLEDLVGALEELKVPTEDRIEIVKELYETGKLHAKLIIDE